jgi:hypothetical protein
MQVHKPVSNATTTATDTRKPFPNSGSKTHF